VAIDHYIGQLGLYEVREVEESGAAASSSGLVRVSFANYFTLRQEQVNRALAEHQRAARVAQVADVAFAGVTAQGARRDAEEPCGLGEGMND